MNTRVSEEEQEKTENRLAKALMAVAFFYEQQEPASLKKTCQAVRLPEHMRTRIYQPLRWAAAVAVAGATLVWPLYLQRKDKPTQLDFLNRPCSVSPLIDRAALYAALPVIPPPPHLVPTPVSEHR